MTQHGSFPGQPRGRRGRHDNDDPEWRGYDATSPGEREFPDLSPIRPREARARDGRVQGDMQATQGHGQPQSGPSGQGGWQPGGYPASGGYPAGDAGYPGGQSGYPGGQSWPQDVQQGYQQGQQAFGQQGTGQPGPGYGQAGPASRQGPGQPGSGSGQSARPKEEPEEDIPEWAEPDSVEAFSERWHRRGLDSRDDRRAGRRKSRRLLFGAGGAAAVAIAVAVYLLIGGGGTATPGFGALITSFLPGELQKVPNACDTVPGATLHRYLPGTLKQAAPPLNTGASTECTWTLDKSPVYRVLQVQIVAYSPSALYQNGSATAAAEFAYQSSDFSFTHPGPKSGQPVAKITDLAGMPGGNDASAFEATQVFHRSGAVTDMATVLVRYRNVIVTVVVNGLDQANGKKKYGPVAMSELTSAAKTVAKQVAGQIVR